MAGTEFGTRASSLPADGAVRTTLNRNSGSLATTQVRWLAKRTALSRYQSLTLPGAVALSSGLLSVLPVQCIRVHWRGNWLRCLPVGRKRPELWYAPFRSSEGSPSVNRCAISQLRASNDDILCAEVEDDSKTVHGQPSPSETAPRPSRPRQIRIQGVSDSELRQNFSDTLVVNNRIESSGEFAAEGSGAVSTRLQFAIARLGTIARGHLRAGPRVASGRYHGEAGYATHLIDDRGAAPALHVSTCFMILVK